MKREWGMRSALLFLGLSPLLVWAAAQLQLPASCTAPLRAWFALHCHQLPSRSFGLGGELLPVCARCAGIYFGLGLAGVFGRARASWRTLFLAFAAGTVAIGLDVLTERYGLRPAFAPLRALTGLAFSVPAGVALLRWMKETAPRSSGDERAGANRSCAPQP